jgi:phosphopantetheine adenylyltransferase
MAAYEVSHPRSDIVRVAFLEDWDARAHSEAMFREVLALLDACENEVILLIVAKDKRPIYEDRALQPARGILYHDCIKKIIIVADEAQAAVAHMNVTRAERGMPPIPMFAFNTEAEALAEL